MRLGILVGRFPPEAVGGAEIQSSKLAKHLAKAHSVQVLTRRFVGLQGSEERDGYTIVRHRSFGLPGLSVLSAIASGVLAVFRLRKSVDVLVCYQVVTSGVIGVLAQKLFGVPAAVWIRGETEYRRNAALDFRLVTPFVLKAARVVLVQTDRIRRDLLAEMALRCGEAYAKRLEPRTFVVPNGVDLPEQGPTGNHEGVVYVGRLFDFKGVQYLLAAARMQPPWPVTVIGDGPDRARLERLARGQSASFKGALTHAEVIRALAGARVLVLPSLGGDGLPNVLLEALSLGVPVVSTRTAGIPDVIREGEFGFLAPPGNAEAIRGAVDKLLGDEALWKRMSASAVREARRYSWDVVSCRLIEVFTHAGIGGASEPRKQEPGVV
jgi:glycosyltransferase involved in cell wall biosynthesis